MKSLSTTRMSSKGQIVIPEEIRKSLKLTEGNQFVVLGEKDVIILKIVTPPAMKDFDHLIAKARTEAKNTNEPGHFGMKTFQRRSVNYLYIIINYRYLEDLMRGACVVCGH